MFSVMRDMLVFQHYNGHLRLDFSQNMLTLPFSCLSRTNSNDLSTSSPSSTTRRNGWRWWWTAPAGCRLSPRENAPKRTGCAAASPRPGSWASCATGDCRFHCDADSPLVKGLLALLCEFFSDAPPAEVAASAADPLDALGLTRHLSPTRQNGLAQRASRIRELATQLATQPNPDKTISSVESVDFLRAFLSTIMETAN
jgi:hypothetical protein